MKTMKKYYIYMMLILVAEFFLFNSVSGASGKTAYLIPDIAAPGMNVYVEILAHVDSLAVFGSDGIKDNNLNSQWQLSPANPADAWKIIFGPIIVSWDGRLISSQAFIHPKLEPKSWKWNEGLNIPIVLVRDNITVATFDFYVVKPCPLGDISNMTSPKENIGGEEVIVLGKEPFGMRSPRGAMLVDSLILADNTKYIVSTEDCDSDTEGNQAYLPFILLSLGNIRGGKGTIISVDGIMQDAGVGGGGGGGTFCDNCGSSTDEPELQRGGNGFTGGGIGGVNNSGIFLSSYYASGGGGIGSGGVDFSKTGDFAGVSLNGVKGASKGGYEASGGGTGHPFGKSGIGSWNDDRPGGYGAGSGKKQKERGGVGAYSNSGNSHRINDGQPHGSKTLVPLAGGSGGGSGNPQGSLFSPHGCSGYGGGGGGGIAIYSRLNNMNYSVSARGANGAFAFSVGGDGGSGSGGGVIINSKLNTKIENIDVRGGNCGTDTAGLGYVRIEADTISGIFSGSHISNAYYATITDTSSYVGKDKTITITGRKNKNSNCDLYIRNERTNWKFLTTVYDEYWNYTLTADDFGYEGDSLFFITAIQEVYNRQSTTYENEPIFIMSQAGANVLEIEKTPYIIKLRDLDSKANIKNCASASITLDVQIISDTGDLDLILWKNKITQKISWGNINIKGANSNFNNIKLDSNGNYILPVKDSAKISVTYTIPEGLTLGIYKDTLELWHNDSLRPNPWKIPVEIEVESISTVNLDSNNKYIYEIDLGSACRGAANLEETFFVANPTKFLLELDKYDIKDINNNSIGKDLLEVLVSKKILSPGDTISVSLRLNNTESLPAGQTTLLLIKHYVDCDGYADTIKIKYIIRETLLEYDKLEVNFGEIRVGADTTVILSLTNKSNYAVQLEKKSLELMYGKNYYITKTTPELPTILGENSSVQISIRFSPTESGILSDSLVLQIKETKNTCEFMSKLPLIGTGTEFSLYANKYDIDFGITDCETVIYDTVWLFNTSNTNINIISPGRIIEDIPGTFKILEQPADKYVLNSYDSARYIISANFSEKNSGKLITGKLLIHNDSVAINLKYEIDDAKISLVPDPIIFGAIQLGGSATSRIVVRNYGRLTKTITKFTYTSANINYEFSPQTLVIPPLDTASFEILATPKLTSGIGSFSDSFNIITNCFSYENNILNSEIIKANVFLPTVDFGDIAICEKASKSAVLVNLGETVVEVLEIIGIEGADSDLFNITKQDVTPTNLYSKESFTVDIMFNPVGATMGTKQAKLILKIFADGQEQRVSIVLRGNINIGILSIPDKPDLGEVYIYSNEKTEIELKNIGNADFIIENIKLIDGTQGFYLDTNSSNNSTNYFLAPNEHIFTNIYFDASELGFKYDTLLVSISYENCRDTARIPICANVIPNNELTLIINKHININPTTKNYRIPVYAIVSQNTINNFEIDTLELEFDRTLFFPTATTAGNMSVIDNSQIRTVSIKNILINNLVDKDTVVLLELVGDIMLGSTDSTSLKITKISYSDNKKIGRFNTIDGYLTINICKSGADRLIYYGDEPNISIKPNPVASSNLVVECLVLEAGKHALEIVSPDGRKTKIKEWDVDIYDDKIFQYTITMSQYSSGIYYLVLTTPTNTYSASFILYK